MKTASPELIAFLQSNTEFLMADLYTITLASGEVLRYTNADLPITTVNDSLNPNLFLYPNDFTNAAWFRPSVSSVVANAATAPDGTNTANKVIFSGVNDPYMGQVFNTGSPIAGKTFTVSFWLWTDAGQPTTNYELYIYPDVIPGNTGQTFVTITTTPTRYSFTWTFPATATGTNINARFDGPNIVAANAYCYAWGASLTVPHIFSATGPLIKRGAVRTVIGLEVDTLDLKIAADMNDTANTIDGYPFIEGILKGGLDGASVLLERAFMSSWKAAPVGTVVLFSGRVSSVSGGRSEARITVKSDIELLNIKLPRNLYQASCMHTLYDTGCAVNKLSFTQSGQVTQVNDKGLWVQTNLSAASSYFDQGVLTFTSGPNAGLRRTVKAYATGQFWFALPLPKAPTVGDTFTVYPGCDKTKTTCTSKFNNVLRFRGFPFIPTPEVAT